MNDDVYEQRLWYLSVCSLLPSGSSRMLWPAAKDNLGGGSAQTRLLMICWAKSSQVWQGMVCSYLWDLQLCHETLTQVLQHNTI